MSGISSLENFPEGSTSVFLSFALQSMAAYRGLEGEQNFLFVCLHLDAFYIINMCILDYANDRTMPSIHVSIAIFSKYFVLFLPFTDDLGDLELIKESNTRDQVCLLCPSVIIRAVADFMRLNIFRFLGMFTTTKTNFR